MGLKADFVDREALASSSSGGSCELRRRRRRARQLRRASAHSQRPLAQWDHTQQFPYRKVD
jgi:hypothetical protein